jgi:oligoribonuclease
VDERLVWVDCEMTGLDLGRDRLLEIACVVTDGELTVLDEGIDLVLHAEDSELDAMVDVVRHMHEVSGLTEAVRQSTLDVRTAEEQVLAYVRRHVPEARRAPLCGNSIATDRSFLNLHMRELDDWLHYRMVDVSSMKELVRRWYPRVYFAQPKKEGGHRALADILESIRELAYYRATIFVPTPGPDTAAAQAAASDLAGQVAAGGPSDPSPLVAG